ncbi:MAG TPA: primosomal protein N' [Clostridiales bacterium]|nr:primosomal protein N' [Clostridiales bacterium]
MGDAVVAQVAVDQTAFHFDKPYTYYLPNELATAQPGCRVIVPFGSGNRKRLGVILSIDKTNSISGLKPVIEVIDQTPLFTGEMLELACWLREHTFCTYFDAYKTMLPAGINIRLVPTYVISENTSLEDIEKLSGDMRRAAEILYNSSCAIERRKLLNMMGLTEESNILERLAKKGIIKRADKAVQRVGDAIVKMVRLADPEMDLTGYKITPKQQLVIDLLTQTGSASAKEACYFTGVTAAVLKGLEKKGILEYFEQEDFRTPYNIENVKEDVQNIVLTDEQQRAFDALYAKYRENAGSAALLYGLTGSGKTQVYLKLANEVVKSGRGVIVMVPEIALTPQTIALFHKYFGNKVAVFHSAMSLGQRMDEFKRIRNKDALIAVGTRSAVFAPFEDIGLIVIDEEHEHTYKSEMSPRYHARDVARFRCAAHKALLVLSSATPSIESYSAAKAGKYTLCCLHERYGKSVLPQVITVDMRQELASGNSGLLSRLMVESIDEVLSHGQQVILLLNRRGHNTYISCPLCGYVATCPNCSITLTYHSANGRMMCHYCGYSQEALTICPGCKNPRMRYSGIGTQKLESELKALFPEAKILRMDSDSTFSRSAYEEKFKAFENREYDILIGTQMVAKGLNFPNVTLVGVLGADQAMFSDDYRSFERAYSLLTQVVGRSGRGDKPGIAIIQTINPDSSLIKLAAEQNYEAFYNMEILSRKAMIFPPFCELVMVGFVSSFRNAAENGSKTFFDLVITKLNNEYSDVKLIILGPCPATVLKVSNKYRYRMLIKCRNNSRFRQLIKDVMFEFSECPESRNVSVFVDVNPEGII